MGQPRHFNVHIWQTQSSVEDSLGFCQGPTCASLRQHKAQANAQNSSVPAGLIPAICNTYIDHFLNSSIYAPWERTLHYKRTIENARMACESDVRQSGLSHVSP